MSSSIMPLPIVLATAVPRANAATKLKKAAQTTARRGESTRVDTTVAMLLAASWNPLMKSNVSATITVIATSASPVVTVGLRSLCVLKHDSFVNIGGVLRLVSRGLQHFKNFLDLDEVNRVFLMLKKVGDRMPTDGVGLVLQSVHLDAVFEKP